MSTKREEKILDQVLDDAFARVFGPSIKVDSDRRRQNDVQLDRHQDFFKWEVIRRSSLSFGNQ
jgi:hypothetical protein